jgi:alpha-L-fucosidase
MGWPAGGEAVVRSVTQPVQQVELLGYQGKMRWMQNETGLRVPMPPMQPSRHAVTLRITFA